MSRVDFKQIELKWQDRWEKERLFQTDPKARKKVLVTFPFPYMNGPLHVGHGFTATRVDAYARFKRMQGYNVSFPWAWHCTGETIAGVSERIKKGDKQMINVLLEIDKVPSREVKKFVDPYYMANYYIKEGRKVVRRIGFSVDMRREFSTIRHDFQHFIAWQFETLRKRGYVSIGTHAVVWCPRCKSATGAHDRLEGEAVAPEEYTLIKFRFGKAFLPAGTFRPETIFGVTNMWIHPDVDYVEARVDGEVWIVSKEAAQKLKRQKKKVSVIRRFKGKELIGKKFKSPVSDVELLILPGPFVDPRCATGVVYSVPAHAPYDWLALRDLRRKPEVLKPFGIDPEEVEKIEPISMIQVEGFGEYPAIEISEKMGIKDQHDPRAEEATKTIYRTEFSKGVLKPICGKYAGKTVRDVKSVIIRDLVKTNAASSMYDLTGRVVCRCGTLCTVKVLREQWFLNYSDEGWKKKAFGLLESMGIYPEEAREWFRDTIEWLREKACVRSTGLGTPLPWQPDLVIETLSDSTVYMAYYSLAKFVNSGIVNAEQLTKEVFDYALLGRGDPKEISKATGIDRKTLAAMRKEFRYWYPVDLRISAKELIPNHLTFSIFHHIAIFPKRDWPRAFGANGVVIIEGKKMSKSKGNFVPLKDAIERYGSDATRCALLLAAEDMNDPDWRAKDVQSTMANLSRLYDLAERIRRMKRAARKGWVERWLESTVQNRVRTVTEGLENLKTRAAIENAFYELFGDLKRYIEVRGDKADAPTLKRSLDTWVRLMTPFAPHLCEEIWHKMGNAGFASIARWPTYDKKKVDEKSEALMSVVEGLSEDTQNILSALKVRPKSITYYAPSGWKWTVYLKALRLAKKDALSMKKLVTELKAAKETRTRMKEAANYAKKLIKTVREIHPDEIDRRLKVGALKDLDALESVKGHLARRFKAKVRIYREDDPDRYDPKDRAKLAEPYRPAIYIE